MIYRDFHSGVEFLCAQTNEEVPTDVNEQIEKFKEYLKYHIQCDSEESDENELGATASMLDTTKHADLISMNRNHDNKNFKRIKNELDEYNSSYDSSNENDNDLELAMADDLRKQLARDKKKANKDIETLKLKIKLLKQEKTKMKKQLQLAQRKLCQKMRELKIYKDAKPQWENERKNLIYEIQLKVKFQQQ